jgi:hypothetical protein
MGVTVSRFETVRLQRRRQIAGIVDGDKNGA